MIFKLGLNGLGYYSDRGGIASAEEANAAAYEAATAEAGTSSAGPDAPIIAALASHKRALDEATEATAKLEAEKAAWGKATSGLRHQAEIIEVRLTDQLQQLTQMLDDCSTADGRATVKGSIGRLRALGTRLLRIYQAPR
jgi:hypothetical protein